MVLMQGKDESFREYVTRCKKVKARISNLNDEVALAALRHGLWYTSKFREELTVRQPPSLDNALHRSINFARAKEERAAMAKHHKSAKTPFNHSKKPFRRDPLESGLHAFAVDSVSRPKNLNFDPEKFCKYHKIRGHSTEECRTTGRLLARKHEARELGKIDLEKEGEKAREANANAKDVVAKRERTDDAEGSSPPPAPKNRIDLVFQAYQRRVESYHRERKPHSEPDYEITFWESGTADLDKPHDRALIVRLDVGGCELSRIMIDTGSSVDLLFYDAFKRMGYPDSELKGGKTPPMGFAGNMNLAKGTAQLIVVDDRPAPFNAILGRPWLYGMKAVPSTYHQCMKFPTRGGIATIYGSQRTSRQCYRGEYDLIKKSNQ
ncbi:PREDICTED: uncharacterized protein LOC104793879 [Camelina sativa]|uniref:Uncharacterized protein LOC104793879 n=1 Tax=Camelina sativa TaxID=90675 RepID=A0ABM0ZPB8_CAMSA|nr:PREDICTED: uncharacterized protein LOC104793879 [Camelina sativa]